MEKSKPKPEAPRACERCQFSEKTDSLIPGTLQRVRICRWGPRQHTQFPTPQGAALTVSNYPIVADDDWCWQWQAVAIDLAER